MWRGGGRPGMSVSASFVWRCLSGSAIAPFPHPSHRTQRADFPHCALGQDFTPSSTSAKGQEWKSVFVLNVVDGCIPSDLGTGASEEIEEERRLLYVAMTRARDDLHLVVPQRFFTRGQTA